MNTKGVQVPLGILALFLGFFWWSDQTAFRYNTVANQSTCSVGQFEHLPERVDLVVIGSSRIRRGFSPEIAENHSSGLLVGAVNFGRPGKSIARSYSIVRDILGKKIYPKYIILEVDLDVLTRKPTKAKIPDLRDIGFLKYADALEILYIDDTRPLLERIHAVYRHWYLKLKSSIGYLLSGVVAQTYFSIENRFSKTCFLAGFDRYIPLEFKKLQEQKAYYQSKYGNLDIAFEHKVSLSDIQNSYSWAARAELYYVEKIRILARQHDIRLLVVRFGEAYQPPLSLAAEADIRSLIPEFIHPPAPLVREAWSGFVDTHHMGPLGRSLYTKWLIEQLYIQGIK